MREAFSPGELMEAELDPYRLEAPQVAALVEPVCAGVAVAGVVGAMGVLGPEGG